jgi:hypothetical protein
VFTRLRDKMTRNSEQEERCYEAALADLVSGQVRAGLMAKALAECEGDERRAQARYLKLAADALYDEQRNSHRERSATGESETLSSVEEPGKYWLVPIVLPIALIALAALAHLAE